ncbi:MAG: hypothetical protein O2819_05620 [Planctomycetota bacterium]|nr:hypothetical protein [Planctomycetota bacterium]
MGCQSEYRSNTEKLIALYDVGQYEPAAAEAAAVAIASEKDEQNRVIYFLEAGRAAQSAGQFESSVRWFDAAFEQVRPFLDTAADSKVTEAFATTLVNQTTAIYRATPNERIMLDTLQSLNKLALNDLDGARIELRRAQDWQDDARRRYAEAVQRAQKDTHSAESKEGIDADGLLKGDSFSEAMQGAEGALVDLKGYGDYANPFTYWLRGTVLTQAAGTTTQDVSNGRSDLVQAMGMVEGDARAFVAAQIQEIDSMSIRTPPARWWLIHMGGLAPHREEIKITLPLPINGTFTMFTAAYPYLKSTGSLPIALTLTDADAAPSTHAPVTLADFDRIVSAEFDEIKGIIYAQETLSGAVKATASYVMQASMNDNSSGLVALGMAIYQLSTQAADLRTWRTLPRQVLVSVVPTPASSRLVLKGADGAELRTIEVPVGSSGFILCTTPSNGIPPAQAMIVLRTSSGQVATQ